MTFESDVTGPSPSRCNGGQVTDPFCVGGFVGIGNLRAGDMRG